MFHIELMLYRELLVSKGIVKGGVEVIAVVDMFVFIRGLTYLV